MAVLTSNALTGVTTRIADASMAAGSIIQVVQTVKTDTTSTDAAYNSPADITGMTCNITPSATSSKIYVTFDISMGAVYAGACYLYMYRDSTHIYKGDADGNRVGASKFTKTSGYYDSYNTTKCWQVNMNYLDSPNTTSQITYKLKVGARDPVTWYLNRSHADGNSDLGGRSASSITLMEVAG